MKLPAEIKAALARMLADKYGVPRWIAHAWIDDFMLHGDRSDHFAKVAGVMREFAQPIWLALLPLFKQLIPSIVGALNARAEEILEQADSKLAEDQQKQGR